MAGSAPLKVQGVTKRFRGLTALNSISFAAEPGQVTAVIGPNGAGKTTLFNVITGFLRPDTGTVQYGGRRLTGFSPATIARLGVIRTFQDVRIFQKLTVHENMAVGARDDGLTAARQLLQEFTGGKIDVDDDAASLGFAQQKLVAIARAVAARADALLLDEPAAGLDDESQRVLAQLITRLREQGSLILLVEHNMDFVMKLSDLVVVLVAGGLLTAGTPQQIQRNEQVIAAYLGTSHASSASPLA